MSAFVLTLIPCSPSPVVQNTHRQTRHFEATNLRAALKMVREACPHGIDNSGEWMVESVEPAL